MSSMELTPISGVRRGCSFPSPQPQVVLVLAWPRAYQEPCNFWTLDLAMTEKSGIPQSDCPTWGGERESRSLQRKMEMSLSIFWSVPPSPIFLGHSCVGCCMHELVGPWRWGRRRVTPCSNMATGTIRAWLFRVRLLHTSRHLLPQDGWPNLTLKESIAGNVSSA